MHCGVHCRLFHWFLGKCFLVECDDPSGLYYKSAQLDTLVVPNELGCDKIVDIPTNQCVCSPCVGTSDESPLKNSTKTDV